MEAATELDVGPDRLRLGRQASRPGRASPRSGLQPHDRRGRPRRPVRHRRRQADRLAADGAASWSPSAAALTPSWRCALAGALAQRAGGTRRRHARGAAGPHRPRPGAGGATRWTASSANMHAGRCRTGDRRGAERPDAILRRAEEADAVVMGASAAPAGDGGRAFLFGALPEAVARALGKTVIVVKTREAIGEATFAAPGGIARVAGRGGAGGARSSVPSRCGSSAGSANRTSTTASSTTSIGWSTSSRRPA